MTDKAKTGQLNTHAARVYDAFFVPALFAQWAEPMCHMADIRHDDTVLDVACGTGIAARAAARRTATPAAVTGLDPNAGMLAVARETAPQVNWIEGLAESLPFSDASYDAVLCQFGLMFFTDRVGALKEMHRVAKRGGRIAVAVWDRVENSPGYAAMIQLIDRLYGAKIADALRAPFVLGDTAEVTALTEAAGWTGAELTTQQGTASFPSIAEWVKTDVRGWTLADLIDDEQFAALVTAAEKDLAHFAGADGTVRFAAPAHIVTCKVA